MIRRSAPRYAAAALLAASVCAAQAATLTARVTDVHDGDTITVRVRTKSIPIRLVHIDAPELDQSWGRQSRRSLQELIRVEEVRVRTKGKDKYSRTLGEVTRVRDGLDVNLEQVRRGMAWSYTRGAARPAFDSAEQKAHEARIGLWQEATPMRPSNWRKKQREKSGRSATTSSEIEGLCDPAAPAAGPSRSHSPQSEALQALSSHCASRLPPAGAAKSQPPGAMPYILVVSPPVPNSATDDRAISFDPHFTR